MNPVKNLSFLILGTNSNSSLEQSYKRALEKLEHHVEIYDISEEIINQLPFKRFSQKIALNIWTFTQKANVNLCRFFFYKRPDFILVFCNAPITSGTILFAQKLGIKCILVWPDPLVGINQKTIENIALYDKVLSYGNEDMTYFKKLGAKNVLFQPLAGDLELHYINKEPRVKFDYDFVFVGNWRPEREDCMSLIHKHFSDKKILIQSISWKKNLKDRTLNKFIQKDSLYAGAYAEIISKGFINLNIIDNSCFPAANMRFFEIPTAGAFQLCSPCPEMENIFKDGEHLLYYKDNQSLLEKIKYAFDNPAEIERMRVKCQKLILSEHTYNHRVQSFIKSIHTDLEF